MDRGAERPDQTLRRELRHRRCPGRTYPQQPLHQQPTIGMIHIGVRVGPGGGDHQLAAAPQSLLLFDLGGQISQGVPVSERHLQLVIEHDLILVEQMCEYKQRGRLFPYLVGFSVARRILANDQDRR